ncbi:FliH/SctL family protein [Aquifex pyrophilus]
MSEEEFKPLREITEKKEERREESFNNVLKLLTDENRKLKKQVEELKKLKERLEEELSKKDESLREREGRITELEREIERLREKSVLEISLKERIENYLEGILQDTAERLYRFLEEALKEFLMELPQDKVNRETLKKILEELVRFREEVKVYLNPEDYEIMKEELENLRYSLSSEGVPLSFFPDKEVEKGSFRIKGLHFTVERSPEEFAKEVFRKVFGDVFKER